MDRQIFNSLPLASNILSKPAYAILARLDGKATFKFMMMPLQIAQDYTSEFPSTVNGSDLPYVTWSGARSPTMTFDIPIAGYPGRDVTAYSQQIIDLSYSDKEKGTPPVLIWRWGDRTFSPCIMPSCTRTETDWHSDGKVLSCIVSIALVKVNKDSIAV